MHYHIAADSCTDPVPGMSSDGFLTHVPLTPRVGNEEIIDDNRFNQRDFLDKVNACCGDVSSACPSPGAFYKAFGDDNLDAYGITLSSKLSGSYNSAVLGAEMAIEDHPGKRIHVFDSKSAAAAQSLILLKLKECLDAGMEFLETVNTVEKYIAGQTTLFVLDKLDALKKNGRLSNLEGMIATVLNLKPVLGDKDGEIRKVTVGRGMKQALAKLVDAIGENLTGAGDRVLAITHCNCLDRAKNLAEDIKRRYNFKDVLILDAAGVSSMYASDGGVVLAF